MNETLDQKAIILDYLEKAYSGAKMLDDVEMMQRLTRAILAFDYDDFDHLPTWEQMQEAYMWKDMCVVERMTKSNTGHRISPKKD